MRLRKIVSGVLIASTLCLSAPVLADPAPDVGMLEGDGGGEGFPGGGDLSFVLAVGAAVLSTIALVDSSRSP
jgi:hypothetical protein